MNRDTEFEQLYNRAWAAGVAAATATRPATMVIGTPTTPFGNEIDYAKQIFVETEGACGFAWVKIRPASSAFGRWLKRTKRVRGAAWNGGYDIWIHDYNQSLARKEAHADAMAKVLTEAGITAYGQGRMD
jgi:hypothetical protein